MPWPSGTGVNFRLHRVMRVIDLRSEVGAHGTRTMPIWGDRYTSESAAAYMQEPYRSYSAKPLVRARILELTYYIQSIHTSGIGGPRIDQ